MVPWSAINVMVMVCLTVCVNIKGLERQRLIGSAVAGFYHTRTITNASVEGLDARQDNYNKGICSPGRLVNNPVR